MQSSLPLNSASILQCMLSSQLSSLVAVISNTSCVVLAGILLYFSLDLCFIDSAVYPVFFLPLVLKITNIFSYANIEH